MSLAIKVSGVSKSFANQKVLKNININVPKNAVYGFLGNNGAGKSTLIRTLLGLLKTDSGEIQINNQSISYKDYQYKNKIGCLVDSPCLYLQLTAREFLGITCKLKKLNKTEIDKLVNMQTHSAIPMNKFSLGMKQRIALANALIGSPQLLILDEPTNGLDPEGMLEIRELLKELPHQIGTTVFLSSHLLDEIEKTATHVGILHKGEMKIESELSSLIKTESSSITLITDQTKSIQKYFSNINIRSKIISENEICLLNIKKNQCIEINKHVVQAGFNLIESRFNQASLESLFLDLVSANKFKGDKHVT